MDFSGGALRRSRAGTVLAVALVLGLSVPAALLPADAAAGAECRPRVSKEDRKRLAKLRDNRPRLLARPSHLRALAAVTVDDSQAALRRTQVRRAANRLVGRTPPPRVVSGGRLQFHEFKNRITTLSLAWRLEQDPRYAEQAERELIAAARYRNWNPSHYLDTAEMTAATALGYDWFHDALSVTGRSTIRNAIISKGLKTSTCFYRRGTGPVTRTNNWGIVTNAGMAMGAIAVAESAPRLSAAVLGGALRHIRPAMRRFGSDGSYPEGLNYWRYATEHAVKLMATLHSGFGRDFGLSGISGFEKTGSYVLHAVGPTGKGANFGNSKEAVGNSPHLLWLSRKFGRPVDAWLAGKLETGHRALHLLWYTSKTRSPKAAGRRTSVVSWPLRSAFFRGRWASRTTGYVAVKGGSNATSHAHPELGTFVFDTAGVRWAQDLGPDNYSLAGYFHPEHSTRYYRLSTPGQNTLTISGRNQPPTATASISHASVRARRSEVVLNLDKAYPMTKRTRRGVALLARRNMLVQDEIVAKKRKSVRWAMHTSASVRVSPDGRRARLSEAGKTLYARIQRPAGGTAKFSVASSEQAYPQASNTGVKRLQIVTRTGRKPRKKAMSRLRLVVFLSARAADRPPSVRRLNDW